MPLMSYVHGGKGYANFRVTRNPYAPSPTYTHVPIVPMRAVISWDEPVIPVELFEGLREVYAWMGGARLCTWSVQGYLLFGENAAFETIANVLNSIYEITQGSGTGFNISLTGAFALEVFDGVWKATVPAIDATNKFPGVGVACALDYAPGAPLAVRIDGISGVPADGNFLKKDTVAAPTTPTNTLKHFIHAGRAQVNLGSATGVHAHSLSVAANREPQVIYSLSSGLVSPDPRFTATTGDSQPFIGNQHFLYPLVTSLGRIRATASFVVDQRTLKRRSVPGDDSDERILTDHTYEATNLQTDIGIATNKTFRIIMRRVALRGKSSAGLATPRVPTVLVAIANPRSAGDTSTGEEVIKAEIVTA